MLCASHLRSYRVNVIIGGIRYHHTLIRMPFWIKLTFGGFMFGPLPHITLIKQIFKLLDNLWKILHTDISNCIPFLFLFLWPCNGLDTQRGIQPLSWYSLIIFWLWRCDFHLFHATKFQRDVQGDVLITILNLRVFPNIATTTIFHVYRCELAQCENFLPERLPSGATTINRRCCCNC